MAYYSLSTHGIQINGDNANFGPRLRACTGALIGNGSLRPIYADMALQIEGNTPLQPSLKDTCRGDQEGAHAPLQGASSSTLTDARPFCQAAHRPGVSLTAPSRWQGLGSAQAAPRISAKWQLAPRIDPSSPLR